MQGAGGENQYDAGDLWGRESVQGDIIRGLGEKIITRNPWNIFAHGHVVDFSGGGSAVAAPSQELCVCRERRELGDV